MVDVKDFLRWYGLSSVGRINLHASVESIVSEAERFFAGFTRVTGTPTIQDERSEVFWWIRNVLPTQINIVDERLPKHNFTKEELDEILFALWTRRDLKYISERNRVEFTFQLCWHSPRASRGA